MPRRRSVLLAVSLVGALLAINAYIYSPWHQHSRFSRQPCSFSQFDYGSSLEASGRIHIEPPAICAGAEPDTRPAPPPASQGAEWFGRAPPA